MSYKLSVKGFEKISQLQDKYRFRNIFEIGDTAEAIEFLQGLRKVYYEGLNVDEEDIDWIENTLDVLGAY